jgi:hypothetical protein
MMKTFYKKIVKGRLVFRIRPVEAEGGWGRGRVYDISRKDNTQIQNSVNAVLYSATCKIFGSER